MIKEPSASLEFSFEKHLSLEDIFVLEEHNKMLSYMQEHNTNPEEPDKFTY